MTRKDYELLAAALGAAEPVAIDRDRHIGWAHAVCKVAEALQSDNPNFNRQRFMRAVVIREVAHG